MLGNNELGHVLLLASVASWVMSHLSVATILWCASECCHAIMGSCTLPPDSSSSDLQYIILSRDLVLPGNVFDKALHCDETGSPTSAVNAKS